MRAVLLEERGSTSREILRMALAGSMLSKSTLPWANRVLVSGSVAQARRRRERPYLALAPHPPVLADPTLSRDAPKRHVDKRG